MIWPKGVILVKWTQSSGPLCLSLFSKLSSCSPIQRPKNLVSRVALLPGKFLRVRKVFARITEKPFKLSQYFQNDWFPDDFQFSGWFKNCPDFSRWLPIFRLVSKLLGFSRWLPIFRMISKLSGFFQMTNNFLDDFKSVQIFQMQTVTTNAANFVLHTNFCWGGRIPKFSLKIAQKTTNFGPKIPFSYIAALFGPF